MRVLLTVDSVGGVWQYCLDLSRALGERDVDTIVAVLGPSPGAAQRAEMRAIPHARLVETGLPLDWLCDGPAPVLAAGARIAELAQDEHVDLVQLNMPTLGAAAPLAVPVISVTHGCVSTWWQAARPGVPLDPAFRWHRTLTGEGLRAADLVVAPSTCYARTVARHYGLGQTPLVVHNGRTPLISPNHPPVQDCVLTVGRLWDQVKRAALLDRVAGRLAIPFHAAGATTGPHGETVALENLHLLGELDAQELAGHLAARPVFVSAASFEPFGLAILEAAAAGCALVLSDIPTFRELWNGAALFVAGDDEAGYAEAIETLIGDCALRLQMGDAARARAERYAPGTMADAMLGLYARALANGIPGRRVAA
ncbi:glycosyltransferase family 4 protein [Sphingomonas sp.]|jgi:glycosyltransferase involved in cell wall biosynthesis|uniref:glycosyltransferase family 4 protein n=1 Tax=Sphingomonas sp. TaxID=28214 RepID=UPI002ED9CE72